MWKSKGLSDESINLSTASNNSLAPALSYFGNKICVKFDRSCLKQDKITFIYGKTVNIYIICEINLWNCVSTGDPTLGSSLYGAVKLVKTSDIDQYKYSGYGIEFGIQKEFFHLLIVDLVKI